MAGKPGRSGPPHNKNSVRHGLYVYRALLQGDGLDQRTSLYKALREKEQDLIMALGGDPSPQERALIGDTVKTMLFVGSVDHYLSGLKSLVRKGRVNPVLPERVRLAAHLRENLKTLGLKRVAREITMDQMIQHALKEQDGNNNGQDDFKRTNGVGEGLDSQ
jgi:hypothetical protein